MRTRSPQLREVPQGRRVLLALAAIFCVVVQAAAIAHVDFAAHGVCREHGELTDLVAQPRTPGAQVSPDPHPDGVAGLHVPAAAVTAVDDHCLLADLVRQTGPTHPAVWPPRISVAWWQARPAPAATQQPPEWLLHLAPKHSPPA